MDVYYAAEHPLREHERNVSAAMGIFIAGFSSILTGLNFIVTIHRTACSWHDLVSATVIHLVLLCNLDHLRPRYAGGCHNHGACRARTGHRNGRFRSDAWAAIRFSSSISSGSIPIRLYTS